MPNNNYQNIIKALEKLASPKKAQKSAYFFKTGPGEYGEGDIFIGLTVPEQRIIAKEYKNIKFGEVQKLLHSPIHEHRFTALLILILQFEKSDAERQSEIYQLYLKNTKYINNWDLVDVSSHKILGKYLLDNPIKKTILYKLAKSSDLWERRIAIVSTWAFIRQEQLEDTIKISALLLNDSQNLIHKATGWMLREMGKRNEKILKKFLDTYSKVMPRTMLRYSIEKLPTDNRKKYMAK